MEAFLQPAMHPMYLASQLGGGPADSGFMRQIQVNVTNHFTFKKAKIAKQLHTKKCK